MICPKCRDIMVTYERNGVHVDQCRGCQGLFLDPGELEHLVRASSMYYKRKRHEVGSGGHEEQRKRSREEDDGFIEDILDFVI